MQQQLITKGNTLYVRCPNLTERKAPEGTIYASVEDETYFRNTRCRIINGRAYTTTRGGDGPELPISVAHHLTQQTPDTTIIHADGNPLNLKRDNLKHRANTPINEYQECGEWAYLTLPKGQTVYVDSEDIPRLRNYQWGTTINHGKHLVSTTFYVNGIRRVMQLNRFLMDLPLGDSRTVGYLNGDILDCRKANLYVL